MLVFNLYLQNISYGNNILNSPITNILWIINVIFSRKIVYCFSSTLNQRKKDVSFHACWELIMTKYVATKYSVCVSLAMTNAYYTKNVSLVTSISVVDIGIIFKYYLWKSLIINTILISVIDMGVIFKYSEEQILTTYQECQ